MKNLCLLTLIAVLTIVWDLAITRLDQSPLVAGTVMFCTIWALIPIIMIYLEGTR
jgi:hypothetical protein